MKITHKLFTISALLGLGLMLFGAIKTSAGGELDGVEYWAVCRGLPANAHWTSATNGTGTWKEIPQTQTAHNVWSPIPVGEFNETPSDTVCTFVCDPGYDWDDTTKACKLAIPTITITHGTNSFTIMDRNLWATEAGTWTASYGHYFQWGNNYGFWNGIAGQTDAEGNSSISTSSTLVANAANYGPSNYRSSTFITESGVTSASKYDYWVGWIQNDKLRWGSTGDGPTTIPGIDASNRQGPCPDGYHVPSQGEWNQLLITWARLNGVSLSDGRYEYFDGENAQKFADDLFLPFAGYRHYDSTATVYDQGDYAGYWSSSPIDQYARFLFFYPNEVYASYYGNRAYAFSLRCFQNSQ